jgi:hypothetical protein
MENANEQIETASIAQGFAGSDGKFAFNPDEMIVCRNARARIRRFV